MYLGDDSDVIQNFFSLFTLYYPYFRADAHFIFVRGLSQINTDYKHHENYRNPWIDFLFIKIHVDFKT